MQTVKQVSHVDSVPKAEFLFMIDCAQQLWLSLSPQEHAPFSIAPFTFYMLLCLCSMGSFPELSCHYICGNGMLFSLSCLIFLLVC